jgi:hypothetical protein
MNYKTLTVKEMEKLVKEGYTFRQRQLYSRGVEGDIAVYYEPRGSMWMRKPQDFSTAILQSLIDG